MFQDVASGALQCTVVRMEMAPALQFQSVYQTLTAAQQNLPQDSGRIEFVNAYGEIDISAIGCGEYRFLCFDFTKGDNPITEFTFTSLQGAASGKFTVCTLRPCSESGGLFTFRIYYYY